ncbi:MAG TPA: hypothetical protein VGR31_02460 [Planctomycetota bacterium]|jgi:hypothetical protein|nr:hypothetical protein [Planctomycetota bacterium]
MDQQTKAATRSEWRELGFFYACDDAAKEWQIVGSQNGLSRFASLLRAYAADPRNAPESEHEHYGPYMYLEVMTWHEPGIDDHSIHGTMAQLGQLAALVEERTAALEPGGKARILEEYSRASAYALVLERREDEFDPASLDGSLEDEAG